MLFPSGLGGVLADVRDAGLRRIAQRRNLVVPSLLADVRVEDLADVVDEPPPEDVLQAAGELAELAEAESATAEGPGADAEESGADGPGADGVSRGHGFQQREPEVMGSASGTHDLGLEGPEPIASGIERVEDRS
jgi:hypothetical protein